jgi:hypothetical protein
VQAPHTPPAPPPEGTGTTGGGAVANPQP